MSSGTIPENRPVQGKDLDMVRMQLGLLVGEACHLFSLSMTRWMHIVRQGADLPVSDSSLAMLVRFYDRNPHLNPIPKAPGAVELFELLSKIRGEPLSQKEFGAIVGAEASAAYRYLKMGGPPSPYAQRLMLGLKNLMLSVPEHKRAELLEDWIQCVTAESKSRGVERGAMVEGKWNSSGTREKRKELISDGKSGAVVKKKGLAAAAKRAAKGEMAE